MSTHLLVRTLVFLLTVTSWVNGQVHSGFARNPAIQRTGDSILPTVDDVLYDVPMVSTWATTHQHSERELRIHDASPGNIMVENFKVQFGPAYSGYQLGVGNVTNEQQANAMINAFFAQHPGYPWVYFWWSSYDPANSVWATYSFNPSVPRDIRPFDTCGDSIRMTIDLYGSPGLGDGCMGYENVGVVSAHQFCVQGIAEASGGHSHGWVSFTDVPLGFSTPIARGKYAATFNFLNSSPGVIKDESTVGVVPSTSICYTLNSRNMLAALTKMNQDAASPPDYTFFSANCVDWTRTIASSAGIALPSFESWGASSPKLLTDWMYGIGDGHISPDGCGRVTFGPPPPPLDASVPQDWDPLLLSAASLDDPQALADQLHVPLFTNDLGTAEIVPGGSISLQFGGIDLNAVLLTVDWGDGSDLSHQQIEAVHSYPTIGSFSVNAAVLEKVGGVHRYTLSVSVTPDGRNSLTFFQGVPDLPPAEGINAEQGVTGLLQLPAFGGCDFDLNANSIPDCQEYAPAASTVAELDGISQYGIVEPASAMTFSVGESLTLEGWILPDSMTANRYLFSKGSVQTANYAVRIKTDGAVELFYRNAANTQTIRYTSASGAITSGRWNHVAVTTTFGASTAHVYVDGVENLGNWTGSPQAPFLTSEPLIVGATLASPGGASGLNYDGLMGELRLWNVMRSLNEVRASAFSSLDGSEPHLVACWPMSDGRGTVAHDIAASAGTNDISFNSVAWIAIDGFNHPCPADIVGNDEIVGIDDLLQVINTWGICGGCTSDIAPSGVGDGVVGIDDLLLIVNMWGPCP